jgi:hypothetical protein
MKAISLITLMFFTSLIIPEQELLDSLKAEKKISKSEYEIFKRQLEFKSSIGTKQRLDSLKVWNKDIVYVEEQFFHKKDSFIVKEYYFSQSIFDSLSNENKIYTPDKYYENGKLIERYFFMDTNAREHLKSIINHMKRRNLIDNIQPLAKVVVVHAGCGMSAKYMKNAKEEADKSYRKARTPEYYLIETLFEKDKKISSFKRPIKSKFEVIVEGYSF